MADLPKDEFQNLVSMNPDEYRETLRNKKGWNESSANQFEQLTRAKSPIQLADQIVTKYPWQPKVFNKKGEPLNVGGQWYEFEDGDYKGNAKLYDTPSKYGINEGRVSKFYLTHKGQPIANYDRGWDVEVSPKHKDFYDKILNYLEKYN